LPNTMMCGESGCDKEAQVKGVCRYHYGLRWRKANPERSKEIAARYKNKNPEKYERHYSNWRKNNKRRSKGHHLIKYWPGSTWEQALKNFDDLVSSTGNVCGICKKPETAIDWQTKMIKSLAVDHCHKTGKVRGLLCQKHNHVIGLITENLEILSSVKDYLLKYIV
jgi:hypothetical protein